MRVLIVDDDQDFLRILGQMLERRGHEVQVRTSAFGVTNLVAGIDDGERVPQPDVVVLDYRMPGLSGETALELLAKDRRTAHIPVLLVSNEDLHTLEAASHKHPACQAHPKGRLGPIIDHVESIAQLVRVVR